MNADKPKKLVIVLLKFALIRVHSWLNVLISVYQRKSAVKRLLIFSVFSVPPWWILVLLVAPHCG